MNNFIKSRRNIQGQEGRVLKNKFMDVKKYELWKDIIFRHGPEKLREFPGFHDEKLKGERAGQRSSRLSLQYRVVYSVQRDIVTVFVLEITPHRY